MASRVRVSRSLRPWMNVRNGCQRVVPGGVGTHPHAALDRRGEPVALIRDGFDVARVACCLPRPLAQPGHRLVETVVADGDPTPPGFDERLFRDDLPRVRDEPEQDRGLWIGQAHACLPPKQQAADGIEFERGETLHDRSAAHAVRADYRVPHCSLEHERARNSARRARPTCERK